MNKYFKWIGLVIVGLVVWILSLVSFPGMMVQLPDNLSIAILITAAAVIVILSVLLLFRRK